MAPDASRAERRNGFLRTMFSRLATGRDWQTFPATKSQTGKGPNGEEATPENFTMMQAFEWYIPDDGKHWKRLKDALPNLKASGVDNLWIPPACKASGPSGNGYDIGHPAPGDYLGHLGPYDLYDLGEFNTKGSVGTKWGTKKELLQLCTDAKEAGVGIYFDAVLNHKAAADHTEKCQAVMVDQEDRMKDVGTPQEIEGWLGFDFAKRGDKYSTQKYHWHHFSGTDYDDATKTKAIFRIIGDNKEWARDVDSEKGNFDYLMFADLDYAHPEVQNDVKNWGVWVGKELGLKGFRFDAIKHYSEQFLLDFIRNLDETVGEGWFMVGEFWKMSLDGLTDYLSKMEHKFSLFDAPLVGNFSRLSTGDRADLRAVFDETLVKVEPYNAVTLVMNHDTQPSQALQAPISGWFVPLAYCLILLREDGYPCLFYGDVYGLKGGVENDWQPPAAGGKIPDMTLARKMYAYGEQNDYFDNPNLIGWVRRGTWDRPDGCAVVLSNADIGEKRMFVGELHHGEKWTDVLGWETTEVEIGEDGFGIFPCGGCSCSIFVNKAAKGRDLFGTFNDKIY